MDDRRLLLFFAFSLAILVGWQMIVPAPPPVEEPVASDELPREGLPVAATNEELEPGRPEIEAPEVERERVEATERVVTLVETPTYRAELDNRGAQLTSFVLRQHFDENGDPLELVRQQTEGPWSLGLVDSSLAPHPLDGALFTVEKRREGQGTRVDFEYYGGLGGATKSLLFDEQGLVEVEVAVEGSTDWGIVLGPGIRNEDPERESRINTRKAVVRIDGDLDRERADKLDELEAWPGRGVSWVGLEDTHYLATFLLGSEISEVILQPVSMASSGPDGGMEITPFEQEDELGEDARERPRDGRWVVRPGRSSLALEAYFGPKEFEVLAQLGQDLEKTVEWGGILRIVVRPMLAGLKWLYANAVPNYGWAIILMTIGLKIVLFPLTHKSYVSMQKMQKLQPQMKAIRQKYRGKMRDKRGRMDLDVQRKMNEEMQALFKAEGASPTGGCLPMILQMPIFFGFFRLLSTAVELRQQPWILWVKDLSAPDPLFVLPVVMGASQIFQQRLTPMSGDPMQRKIMQLFPWMFMIFAIGFPSGLVLYWTVNNLFTIGQTAAYKKWRERKDEQEKLAAKARKKERKNK